MANMHRSDPALHARAVRAMHNIIENGDFGVLDRARESGEPLIIGWADGRQRKVTIQETDTYEVVIDGESFHKTSLLYAIPTKSAKKFKKDVKKNKGITALGLTPAYRTRDRLHISKMVLQKLIDESLKARFTLTDGTVIPCRVRSFSQWEVYAEVRGGPITIFRHGVYRIEAGNEVLADYGAQKGN